MNIAASVREYGTRFSTAETECQFLSLWMDGHIEILTKLSDLRIAVRDKVYELFILLAMSVPVMDLYILAPVL